MSHSAWMSTLVLAAGTLAVPALVAQQHTWRSATEAELAQALPSRAPVERERIETEMRTASGIVDEQGHVTAGVVLITAGYSADGKYSHYLIVAAPLRLVGGLLLPPGKYVLGWKRVAEGLNVHLYDAATGQEKGAALARLLPTGTRVEPFRISPPGEHGIMQIGRFGMSYTPVP